MVENIGKLGFHYYIKELFERIPTAVTDSNHEILEETKSNTKPYMELDESSDYMKTLELMNKIGVIHSNLIKPTAKLSIPEKKSQFRLYDDPDSDKCND